MFDTVKFVRDHFGTVDAMIGLARQKNVRFPERDTVRKWITRGNIPSDWLPILLMLIELDIGQPVSILPYIDGWEQGDDIFG